MKHPIKSLKVHILSSKEQDYSLYNYYTKKCLHYNTGENRYEAFLGYLKDEINERFKGKNEKQKNKIIKEIISRERKKFKEIISRNLTQIKEEWENTSPLFVKACETTFDNCPFPYGDYKAIMTIWGRYPYDKKKRVIYFPTNKDWMLFVIIHELLHLVFFNFYANYCKDIHLSQDNLWELSEILDVLIMNEEPYLGWAKMQSRPYPAHQKNYEILLPLFKRRNGMHSFIEEATKIYNQ